MILSNFVNLFLLGKLMTLANDYGSKSSLFQMRLDQTNEIMIYIKMSYDEQLALLEFYFKTQSSMDLQEEHDIFFDQIPPSYRMLVQQCLFDKTLIQNQLILRIIGQQKRGFYLKVANNSFGCIRSNPKIKHKK